MILRWFCILIVLAVPVQSSSAAETASSLIGAIKETFTGDLDQMRKRRVIRVLIPFSSSDYFIHDGAEKGLAAEMLREFERDINAGVEVELKRTRFALIPTRRDELIEGLIDGIGDIAVANLTITEQRLEQVDFSRPFIKDVREVLVTTNKTVDTDSIDSISGMEVHVRRSSSYYESLNTANEALAAKGLAPINLVIMDEWLEDEDLLEMLHAGTIGAIVIDEHKVKPWLSVFDTLKVHSNVPLREGGSVGWAFRKNSPDLAKAINAFATSAARGTKLGNILLRRYYHKEDWIENPNIEIYRKKLASLRGVFQKYGEKYHIDPLLLAALSFQESKFNENARSSSGAVGLMQMLPSTAADKNVQIDDVTGLESNVEASAKYLRFMANHYFAEGGIADDQKILMALASYNAGPERVARVRNQAKDPNQWFESVEWQVAQVAGSEPVRYVKNIYVYYVLFKLFEEGDAKRTQLKHGLSTQE